ncbi:hypothetical protein C0706_23295 [Salmonella enterica]|nr:hypothetical protein [Salmonella enterica]ECI3633712.1 hypothetical protein [Salmonella enterica subsp. houtenae]EBE7794585.1 hypothetical protein [Salmonella enterica]EBR1512356.1 hypothetical protein [Salmonella enterica]EBR4463708.1 hypothetical protein [Salmonella enterica]
MCVLINRQTNPITNRTERSRWSAEMLAIKINEITGCQLHAETLRRWLSAVTPTRLRHFFSQIKGEVGSKMKGRTESFQFSPATLRSFSSYYRIHPLESEEDGYEKNLAGIFIRRANEQSIGRKHYLRLNGNRQSNPDDGYNFRGRGLIQVTGYEKYHSFMEEYYKYWQGDAPDTVSEPEKINEMPYAIRSALWFWLHYEVYLLDYGKGYNDVVDVTKRVNGGSMGLDERQTAYTLCEKVFL